MNTVEILNHNFLNPKYLQGKRDGLALTNKASKYYEGARAEVAELEARAEAEQPLRAERDRVLAALKAKGVIPSKYGDGYVSKGLVGWSKIGLADALALIAEG